MKSSMECHAMNIVNIENIIKIYYISVGLFYFSHLTYIWVIPPPENMRGGLDVLWFAVMGKDSSIQ